jgi:hypothetical protein
VVQACAAAKQTVQKVALVGARNWDIFAPPSAMEVAGKIYIVHCVYQSSVCFQKVDLLALVFQISLTFIFMFQYY